jgi:hypothetical protein
VEDLPYVLVVPEVLPDIDAYDAENSVADDDDRDEVGRRRSPASSWREDGGVSVIQEDIERW